MFLSNGNRTVLAKGLKVVGSVTADGLVEVSGKVDGPLNCTSVVIGQGGQVSGNIAAQRVVVDGGVEGKILGEEVVLKCCAHVVGDIECRSVGIDKGAFIEGRLVPIRGAIAVLPNAAATNAIAGREPAKLATPGAERPSQTGRAFATLVDGKEILFAALIGLTLVSLMTWLIVG
jgi:cytoskeletal protein CcmA (bactofilin family)